MTFEHLFSPITVGPRTFRNRIFSTGHQTMLLGPDQLPDDRFVAYHEARAKGGAGLIVTEAASIHLSNGSHSINAATDACIPAYRRVAEAVQKHDCAIFGQLAHAGAIHRGTADGTLGVPDAPSQVRSDRFHVISRAMTRPDLEEVISSYGDTALRMKHAGLDGVEILASQNCLPAQFLNPRLNRRTDEYGGSLDNRLRFLREVIERVRDRVGTDIVVGMRISGDELQAGGTDPAEILEACAALGNEGGLDYLNVIAGGMMQLDGSIHIVPPMAVEHAYLAPLAHAVKQRVPVPVFVAGRINQPQQAEQILESGQADMIGMTRAQIADPQMANKARDGRMDDIRACIACNQACIGHMQMGIGISCIQRPETGREQEFDVKTPTATSRTVFVAGGGPAGMKAAAVTAERGHRVILCEASARLGGQALLAQELPGRAEFGGIITNLAHEMEMHGVEVRLGTKVDRALVEAERADAVVVATGALPWPAEIEGGDEAHLVEAWAVIKGEANVGGRVVVADWRCDWIGLGVAEKLARDGCKVTLAVDGYMPGEMLQKYVRDRWIGDIHKLGVEVVPFARLYGADDTTCYLQHVTSGEPIILDEIDTIVTSLGHRSVIDLADALEDWAGEVVMIGDCLAPRTCEEAVLEGLRVGVAL
jgi:2,4-dienoyl-CoA reductase-like NADH-dependent reductase (Old Yellow Enzyme family)